ncbi:MAG: ABC transporter ATP-binding protein [Spirochaetes bacterium GWD1_61_31]|nr:MAG: ABC transporter ATP-binding protein [Spirochaetes bacterium GWB1_60_80]OHD33606.1 MAG: ABC transporter ATP-binding protein [Spirochaetes bacterium GWC1_61_12]OHD38536.1 MAG: ABC transporter ATP-binding protein [Spirochaetes bacterium GWD1_61_31]OHD43096.1 MAG: ABC transporter ATP-binding protein [Spirochaetes bacterium GWE1_60_18]OHD59691.1 MAG: ABC transporter ATP-binding protein [Spirochaetes bacterium GWF1_60_12]HAP43832.1 ABC transporter ATP-binding protein [Spirochaetaceae bacteri
MLETGDFRVSYGRITALKGVDIKVAENEAVAVIGANGAGKSSLMNGLAGIVEAQGGVLYKGADLSRLPSHQRVKRGLVLCPEGRRIFPELNVEENLRLGAYRRGAVKTGLVKVYDMFPRLAERRTQAAGYLSGGEQQMLAIGRALMAEPELLMLDEPSLGLAPVLVDQVFETLRNLRAAGIPILLVEQNAVKALAFADRAYILENGRVVMSGKGAELLADERVKQAYLGI